MKRLWYVMLPLLLGGCHPPVPEEENVSVEQASQLIENDQVKVLDVRTDEEWARGHITGAEQMNFYEENFDGELDSLPKDETYLVYCHSGGRSAKTLHKMKQMGFEKVYNLDGGITAWQSAGKEVEE